MRSCFVLRVLMMTVCAPLAAAAQYAPVTHIPTNTEPVATAYDSVTHRAYVAGFEVGTRAKTERVHYPDVDLVMERDEKGRRYLHRNGEPYP